MLTDKDLEELRQERHDDYVAKFAARQERALADLPTKAPTIWSEHLGYDLARYAMTCGVLNDRDRYNPNLITASVMATKFTGHEAAHVNASMGAGPVSMGVQMSPSRARTFANALLAAADIVEAFEADHRIQAESAELARYNAGPIDRIELAGGVVAFEPVTEGGAA